MHDIRLTPRALKARSCFTLMFQTLSNHFKPFQIISKNPFKPLVSDWLNLCARACVPPSLPTQRGARLPSRWRGSTARGGGRCKLTLA